MRLVTLKTLTENGGEGLLGSGTDQPVHILNFMESAVLRKL